ncbi:hypothetical protein Leryth_013531 [Lithospermum erythrorhizon]|uniref:GPI-anchored protein LLG1-like domain-containing protein n=1 Tax=Lithospermum erythrorhizon TaxID=34254 RepID=A0AAV3QE17_LITER|nr:hypothetical protein Leryth_013531 [Lithospermum erythrorhizon]
MGNTGRTLLQQKATCSINFEQQNYTIITSQCKGPNYNKTSCCEGFKQFACPFVDQINDLKTTCADSLFSYINLYGKYPPGLFANMCSGKEGVDCEGVDTPPKPQTGTGLENTPILLMIVASLIISMSRMMF